MKKILLLLFAGSAIALGCHAKCIQSLHATEKHNKKDYPCAIKKDEQVNFKDLKPDDSTTLTVCKNCGCTKDMHDGN